MSDYTQRYTLSVAQPWTESPTDEYLKLLASAPNAEESTQGKGKCLTKKISLHTSNDRNQKYYLNMYRLNESDVLQRASVHELPLHQNSHIQIHRISIIRNGDLLSKINDSVIRVFDDEQESGMGTINKLQKLHILINDLRLKDVLILEYTNVHTFGYELNLDKQFYYHIQDLVSNYWIYENFEFVFQTDREEIQIIRTRYLKNEQGEEENEGLKEYPKGSVYRFKRKNFYLPFKNSTYNPYIEIATKSDWELISSTIKNNEIKLSEKSSEEDIKLFDSVLEGLNNSAEKARACIEYVQNNIVYLFDAEIMHGHFAQSISKTLMNRSGDCKAKSFLLAHLLNYAGIRAVCIIVNYEDDRFLSEQFPSPFNFNHEIVKFECNGTTYFVDATWSDRAGTIENRTQPFFRYYLPIEENATLKSREERLDLSIKVEEDTRVVIKNSNASITTTTYFRKSFADSIRSKIKHFSNEVIVEDENNSLRMILGFTDQQEWKEKILEASYTVLVDDINQNVLTTVYSISIKSIFSKGQQIFKYYHPWSTGGIEAFRHDYHLFDPSFKPSFKSSVTITADRMIDRRNPITKQQITIDNPYFHFSNLKKIGILKASVVSEYQAKSSEFIQKEDLEKVRKDYVKIGDSNIGIGIVYLNIVNTIVRYTYIVIFIIFLITTILSIFSQQ
jgi:hypothetical protein